MQYEFRNLDPVEDNTNLNIASEGFIFNNYDTRSNGWWLTERTAPTPEEQEITESVPYRQGSYDFSMIGNERFFNNREITYKLLYIGEEYRNRKGFEQELKRQLMPCNWGKLTDTHEPTYYWWAKCKSVEVDDNSDKEALEASIVFTTYPYAYTNHNEGADYWDDVFFPHWIWQPVKFNVNGSQDVNVKNIGSRPVLSSFVVTGDVKAKGSFGEVSLNDSNYKQTQVVLDIGDNQINLSGSGTIEFVFKREEMV